MVSGRLFLCFLFYLAPLPLSGQRIHARLVGAESGAALPGAFVILQDSLGKRASAALSDQNGAFILNAPAPGSYSLRVERLGLERQTVPGIRLSPQQVLTTVFRVREVPISLGAISVRAERDRCRIRRELSSEAATLWEEARKALSIASWTAEAGEVRYQVLRSLRQTEARSGDVLIDEQDSVVRSSAGSLWASASARDLLDNGFVQRRGDRYLHYGPDATVLLSDRFVDENCFYVLKHPDRPELIGLAFRPRRAREVTGIRGTLWLQKKSAELHSIDFDYVRTPYPVMGQRPGGRIGFERLATGQWIMSQWALRLIGTSQVPTPFSARGARVINEHKVKVVKAEMGTLSSEGASSSDAGGADDLPLAGGNLSPRLYAAEMCGRSAPPGKVHVAGFVGSGERRPIAGALVKVNVSTREGELWTGERSSDLYGFFHFCDLPSPSSVAVAASALEFEPKTVETVTEGKAVVSVKLILKKASSENP